MRPLCVHHCAICRNAILLRRFCFTRIRSIFHFHILMVWIRMIPWDSLFHYVSLMLHADAIKMEIKRRHRYWCTTLCAVAQNSHSTAHCQSKLHANKHECICRKRGRAQHVLQACKHDSHAEIFGLGLLLCSMHTIYCLSCSVLFCLMCLFVRCYCFLTVYYLHSEWIYNAIHC